MTLLLLALPCKLSFILSFIFSWAPPLLLHIFSLLLTNCTTTYKLVIEPRALNAEFQHFILSCSISFHFMLRFNKNVFYFAYTRLKERIRWGVKGGPKPWLKTKVTLWITLFVFTIIIEKYSSFKGLCKKTNLMFTQVPSTRHHLMWDLKKGKQIAIMTKIK